MEQYTYREQFELEDDHWWFAGRRKVMWSLLRRAGVGDAVRVLDAGCGSGRNLLEFGSLGSAEGIDTSSEAVEFCRLRGIAAVRQARVEQLPLADGSFDLILATDVLEHIRDDVAALRELHRVAAQRGHLLATVPAYQWLWSQHDHDYHHFRRYTLPHLRERVLASGWRPVVSSYFNTLLFPPIAALRVCARRRPTENRRPDLRLTPTWVNRVMEQPLRLEAALIERGVRLPVGVSIGLVCRAC